VRNYCRIIFGLLLMLVSGAATAAPTLLAVEVRMEGDANPWRWWCGAAPDPIAKDVLMGLTRGLEEERGLTYVAALPADTQAVHPMYCGQNWDDDLALNLAGLLGADTVFDGQVVVHAETTLTDPPYRKIPIEFIARGRTARLYKGPTASGDSDRPAHLVHADQQIAWASKDASIGTALARSAQRLGIRLGTRARRVLRRPVVGERMVFLVRGSYRITDEDDVARRLRAALPDGWALDVVGFRNTHSVFVIRAKEKTRDNLLAVLQNAIDDPRSGPPPLLYEGMDGQGFPTFIAVDAKEPLWVRPTGSPADPEVP